MLVNSNFNDNNDSKYALKSEIPTTLPANGGNADTLDGLHADGFIKVNDCDGYDCNTLYNAGLYLCNGSATNTPNDLKYGSLFVMPYRKPYNNGIPDYCAQIFIPNGDADDTSLWYRTSLQNTWNEWKRSCDGGNADTLDGLHADSFALKTDIPTSLPVNGGTADTARQVTSPSSKVKLYEDGEGGNLELVAPDGVHMMQMDLYNNESFRMYFYDGSQLYFPVDFNFSTGKFNIIGNADTVDDMHASDFVKHTGGTMTGALVAQSNTNYTTPQVRNVTMSTSDPSGGSNGQIHFQYS